MSDKLSRNYIVSVVYQIISMVFPIITTFYLTRVIGSDGIGNYSYASSICSYFVIFSALGFSSYGRREIAMCQDRIEEYSKIYHELQRLKMIISLVVLFVYVIFVFACCSDKILYLILAINIINNIVDINWFYSGLEKFESITVRSIFVRIFYLFSIFIFVRSSADFYLYVLIEVLQTLLISLVLFPGLNKIVSKRGHIDIIQHLRPVFTLFIPTVAIQIYTVLDKSMIGMFSAGEYSENAYYELAQSLVKSCLVLATTMGSVASPRISYAIANRDYDAVKNTLYNSYKFVWLTSIPIIIILCFISSILVPLYYGPGYERVIVLIQMFSPLILIIGLSNVTGIQYFIPRNFLKYYNISLIVGSFVNLFLNLFLIPRYFAIGATLASVIAETFVTSIQFYFASRAGEIKIRRVLYVSIRYVILGIFLIFIIAGLKTVLGNDIFSLILLVLLGLLSYFLLLIFSRDRFVFDYLKKRLLKIK